MGDQTGRLFLDYSVKKLEQFTSRIADCLGRLSADQLWIRGTESQNAVGNLVLHLSGNVRQWIVSGVGGAEDARVRDREFAERGPFARDELAAQLQYTMADAIAVLRNTTPEGLMRTVRIQGFDLTVLEAVYHVVEHFAQHTGQIFYATKLLTGQDLGYYGYLSRAASHPDQVP